MLKTIMIMAAIIIGIIIIVLAVPVFMMLAMLIAWGRIDSGPINWKELFNRKSK